MMGFSIKVFDCPDDAPNYNRDTPDTRGAELVQANVIRGGMASGKCSVDLVFKDRDGGMFMAMTSGALVDSLAAAIRGAESRQ